MIKRRSFLYLDKYLKRSMQIHLIIINTNALVEILDRQSKVSQQPVEKIQKSNDGFAIIVLTFMIVLHSFTKLQKTFSHTFATDVRFYKKRCSKSGRVAIRFRKERENCK